MAETATQASRHISSGFHVRQIVASEEDKESLTKLENIPEVAALERVLASAFGEPEDLFTTVVMGKHELGESQDMVGPFWKSTVIAGLLGGEVYAAETLDDQKKVIGCAVWFPPGRSMYDSLNQQEMVLGPLMNSFEPALQGWWGTTFLPKYNEFTDSALGKGVKHNSWHLQTLGVHPTYQRKYVARHLVDAVAKKAALTGSTMCVECSKEVNVDIYMRLGFVMMMPKDKVDVVNEPKKRDFAETFRGVHDTLEFPLWAMLRRT